MVKSGFNFVDTSILSINLPTSDNESGDGADVEVGAVVVDWLLSRENLRNLVPRLSKIVYSVSRSLSTFNVASHLKNVGSRHRYFFTDE